MSWPIGTIVVCVDDSPPRTGALVIGEPLAVGAYFTVRGWSNIADEGPGLLLCENRGDVSHVYMAAGSHDWPWNENRFRLAEGGACEAERARAMNTNKASK